MEFAAGRPEKDDGGFFCPCGPGKVRKLGAESTSRRVTQCVRIAGYVAVEVEGVFEVR
jgi:hypothetical protein